MRKYVLLPLLTCCALSTGCMKQTPKNDFVGLPPGSNELLSSVNPEHYLNTLEGQLASSADRVAASLHKLALVQYAKTPKLAMPPIADANRIGMGKRVSIQWTGPAEPLVRKLADMCHYKVQVLGHRTPSPTLISINVNDTSIAEIIRNVTYQATQSANIAVFPDKRIIEIRYKGL